MAIQFDGIQLADLTVLGLPINPAPGEVAFDGQLKVYSAISGDWETFTPVDSTGQTATMTMAPSAVIAADDGVGGAPSYTFASNSTYGMFYDGGSTIGMVGNSGAILNLAASGTPANFWQMESSDAASPVEMKALGSDTDIDMLISPKGDGVIQVPAGYETRSNFGDDSLVNKEYVDDAITTATSGSVTSPLGGNLDLGSFGIVGTAGSTSAGGDVDLTAGNGDGDFNGGAVNINGGSAANGSGDGGAVTITAGNGAGGVAANDGGDINLNPGTGAGAGVAGEIVLGGDLNVNGNNIIGAPGSPSGGQVQIIGGISTGTPGTGGKARLIGGYAATSGNGGAVDILGANGVTSGATNRNGGDVNIYPGKKTNSGVDGAIVFKPAGASGDASEVRWLETASNGSNYMGLQSPAAVTTSNVFEMAPKVVTRTAGTHSVDETEDLVVVNAVGGNVILNLHSAANERFRPLNIKRIDASGTFTVTINRAGSDLIDGATSYVIPASSQWTNVTLQNDKGTAWYIL